MISIEVRLETDVLDAIRDAAVKAPGLMNTVYKRRVRKLRTRMLTRLRVEPGPPHYPIRWTSDKQRRFVMAKLRRENNLPYQRTHLLVNSYDVVLNSTEAGGILLVTNDDPSARFVVGDDQQGFHIDTGWQSTASVIVEFEEIAFNELVSDWYLVVDPFAGVPQI